MRERIECRARQFVATTAAPRGRHPRRQLGRQLVEAVELILQEKHPPLEVRNLEPLQQRAFADPDDLIPAEQLLPAARTEAEQPLGADGEPLAQPQRHRSPV